MTLYLLYSTLYTHHIDTLRNLGEPNLVNWKMGERREDH
jgi:hypothetical protein